MKVQSCALNRPLRRSAISAVRVLRAIAVFYFFLTLLLMLFEESLIFFPSPYPQDDRRPAGLGIEDAEFTAADGTQLHGWYVPHDQPRAVVLIAHGNAGNVTHRADWLAALHAIGASTLVFDYRGYGRSNGKPNEAGILADARAARRWLAQRAGVAEKDIVLVGESIGGAVVTQLAAADGARGLILENTFSSLADAASVHYPWLPVRLVLRTRLDSASVIRRYYGPLLQIHGDRDTIVPIELGQRLFAAANEPKEFVVVSGADHNDPRSPAAYQAIDRFLKGLPE